MSKVYLIVSALILSAMLMFSPILSAFGSQNIAASWNTTPALSTDANWTAGPGWTGSTP